MNYGRNNAMPGQSPAYRTVQESLHSANESLQVDASLEALREAVEFNTEIVDALIRRLEPVTGGGMGKAEDSIGECGAPKVPLALRIDSQREQIEALTRALRSTVNALQI